jgi:LacI family transcriptional regulator, sucrose operon repressor
MATIKDVAVKAGVSTATVSRVLNKSRDVTDTTRRRVEHAITELKYHPDAMARSLQTGRSYLIGIILPELDHPFFARLLQAAENACAARGYRLLICVSAGALEKEIAFAQTLRRNKADGLLLCSRAKDSSFFSDYSLPVVSIEYAAGEAIPSVCCDNHTGGILAAQTLLDGGCRHPLVLGEHPDRAHLPAHLRVSGFTEECARRGIPCVIYNGDKSRAEKSETFRAFFSELMEAYPETDGLFTTSDLIAAWASTAFRELGICIPDRLQLVGFDGLDIAEYLGITTVVQPVAQMGEFALDMLLKLSEANLIPMQSMLPVTLLRRGSTKTPA